jgi:hypothetical protein
MVSRRVVVVVAGAALAAAAWMPAAIAVSARPSATSSGWQVQQYFGTFCGEVSSITATGPDNAWAVGDWCPTLDHDLPLFAHWDGTWWQELRPPDSQRYEFGSAVASVSGSYSWIFAPGFSGLDGQDFALLRSNGWKAFQLANDSVIDSAVVFGRSDAWGFGTVGQGAYAVRFNGRAWRRVPIPVIPVATAGPKPDDIWAVGPRSGAAGVASPHSYQLAHWTGRAWQVRPFPALGLPAGAFPAGASVVSAGSGGVFVAVQFDEPSQDGGVLLHWDGARWTSLKLPVQLSLGSRLGPLARDGRGGLWVASIPSSGNPDDDYVMLHRSADGVWSQATVALNCPGCLFLDSMRLIPGTASVWAGGLVGGEDGTTTPVMIRFGQ